MQLHAHVAAGRCQVTECRGGLRSHQAASCRLQQLSLRPLQPLQGQRLECRRIAGRRTAGRRRHSAQALFTGIVQGKGKVAELQQKQDFRSIHVSFPPGKTDGIQIGASVAINGTCLTVTAQKGDCLSFDVIEETLRATSLGRLQEGSEVNFERSARMGDEIGGHHVSGHVHTTATITGIQQTDNNRQITMQVPPQWMKYILPKGFVAVDGISLTVGEVGPDWFNIYLIPETLRVTILGEKREGDVANIEIEAQTQAIVDTVEKVVGRYMQDKQLVSS